MNRFDDLLPEERVPQHEELITLLQRAYRKPVPLLPIKEAQVIERVRERLMQSGFEDVTTEDIPVPQRGVLDSTPLKSVSPVGILRRDKRRLRLIALLAATLVITMLLLAPLILLRHSAMDGTGELPTLTLYPNAALVGDSVTLTLKHVTPFTNVVLTHDIQEPILINGSSTITTDAQGTARVPLVIDSTWGPGFHLIVAEGVATRNTASATLQITGQGATTPPYLSLDTTPINMGADIVGANTIHTFTLANNGGGSITWSASSNQPWLLISPSQGTFSQKQLISLAVQRVGLKAGDYSGSITYYTNVGVQHHIKVDMTVRPLPPNAGPVLAVSPALLSFTTTDGDAQGRAQSLTIANPGSQTLSWSLAPAQGLTCNWLSATPTSGIVAPGAASTLNVVVQSQCLLPGSYLGTLTFTGIGAIDGSQAVNVSLTVQPHCGLVTSTGSLAFTVVQGQNALANQTVSLNATAGCAGTPLPWTSTSTAPWLSITPASGRLKGTASAVVTVSVNAAKLPPKTYYATLSLVSGQSTLTVMVQLTVQTSPAATSPIMGASPLSLNFSNTLGQPSPTGRVVTITNSGKSLLKWKANPMSLSSSWLGASPSGGAIVPGQTGQVTININTANLTPGSYVGLVMLNGVDDTQGNLAPGSPQAITITLVVQPPCTISPPSSSALSFSAVQGAIANPPAQSVMFTGTGNCVWPVTWTTSVTPAAAWLTLTPSNGAVQGTGQSGSMGVAPNIVGLPAGTYITQVAIAASDASGATVQGIPQSFSVTLTILSSSCVFSPPTPGTLSFTVPQGTHPSAVQNVTLSETGTCALPITWTASTDGLKPWVVLSATSGTDNGSGSTLGVSVDPTGFPPGSYSYSGIITITAIDSTGAKISGSRQTISMELTVTP